MASTNPNDFKFIREIPEGDDLERHVCTDCGWIHYENPKIVVGSVVTYEDKFLLCRRAIEPRKGFWTLPAGFMEQKETTEEGAAREAWEEAEAKIIVEDLLAIYNVTHISQVQIMYRAHLEAPEYKPGKESLEVDLFAWDEIPWDQLAFPTVVWALHQYRDVKGQKHIAPFGNATGDLYKQSFEMLTR
ncbi:NUDIX domain-containing protein [Sneathiella sp. P13V-1]|uniref:NUDIX hydrolase n=1 Tax=Sneathiella sp. P13V-1 TaxID=2697366 RepID=UPI00187B25F4|nr:NUDIX hydrolase [Sneathiella sp. P13V-1]MBE7636295.1 NUDIX domain-containing protein [Sneathiella sp. P13V-1]